MKILKRRKLKENTDEKKLKTEIKKEKDHMKV